MKLKHKPDIHALFRHVQKSDDFVTWLRDEGDILVSAADVLGGQIWARKAKEIVVTARTGGNVAARRKTLIALRQLLHRDDACLLNKDDAWRLMSLHPDDPKATRAMLCADAIGRGIRAFEALRLAGVTSISRGV